MNICITGATGFIGSHVVNYLSKKNYKILVLTSEKTTKILNNNLSKFNLETSKDIKDNISNNYDVFLHMAGCNNSLKKNKQDQLLELRRINRDLTISLGKLAAESGIKRFIYISSIKVNGETTQIGSSFSEQMDNIPSQIYGLSKYEAEQGLLEIAKNTSMEVVIIRPPLVYGPGVKGNLAKLITCIRGGIPLPFALVKNSRSFIAIENLVDFILLCTDIRKSSKAGNEIFVISDGQDISLRKFIKKISYAYQVNLIMLPLPLLFMKLLGRIFRKTDIVNSLLDNLQINNSKAYELLNWRPIITIDKQLEIMAKIDR